MNDLVPTEEPKALQITYGMTFQEVAKAFHLSRMFKDVATEAQAVVKIMAGKELGLGPFASMSLINVIQGKVVMSGHGIATLIDSSPDYDYSVDQLDDKGCTITFSKKGKKRGTYSFGEKDAKAAGLLKDNYVKYPRDMYFNRCISAGYKKFIPGVTLGQAIYVEGEIDPDPGAKKVPGETVEAEFTVQATVTPFRDEMNRRLKDLGWDPAEATRRLGFDPQTMDEAGAKKVLEKLKVISN